MLQSSITGWLKKPAAVKQAGDSFAPSEKGTEVSHSIAEVETGTAPLDRVQIHGPASKKGPVEEAFALRPLPANVKLVPLTEELMPAFKRLNTTLFPIAYPPSFYTETMTEPHHSVTLMALWNSEPLNDGMNTASADSKLIGAIRCRILPSANLYISTIGLLSPYRSHGIALHLLQRMILKASKEHDVKCVTAHVWEANELGLDWYKRRGFDVVEKEDGYYRRLKPSGALLVRKWIGPSDLLKGDDKAPLAGH